MQKKKQGLLLSILGIIGLVLITVGVSYAFFSYAKEGSTENSVKSGKITFLYTEVSKAGKGIRLENAFPISDEIGKKQVGEGNVFDFKITSTTPNSIGIPYEVTVRKKVDSTLDEEVVKIYLTKVNGSLEEELLLDNYSNLTQTSKVDSNKYSEKVIYQGKVPSNTSNYEQDFRLRMWIDEDTDFSSVKDENGDEIYPYNNKTFTITVNAYANGEVITEEEIEAEGNANIKNILVENKVLTKIEGKEYDYEGVLPKGTTNTVIEVETENPKATVKVEKIDSLGYQGNRNSNIKRLSVSKNIEIQNEENYYKVTVTSENKKTVKEYKLKIRIESSDATLKSLSVTGYTLSPVFNSNTISYTLTVPSTITSLSVNPIVNHEGAQTEVSGNTNLKVGENTITIKVTAEDKTVKNYTIKVTRDIYKEALLNGTEPIVSNNLIPVTISDNGTVKKADLSTEWYNYSKKRWANAVILKNESSSYSNNQVIPEEAIESYFVWIPKYSYQLFNLGNYSSEGTLTDATQTINIRFGTTNTSDSNTGECTTPRTAGATGNCKVGDYMTHPAFLAFDTTGFWVGKFEIGYNGATSTSAAQVNSNDSSKIIIKPNVYSWRNLTVGNMFQAGYNYKRELDSHMMKNTEWGAVAYLTNSNYGRCENGKCTEIRINNNSAYITGYAGTEEATVGYNGGTSIAGNRNESTLPQIDGTYTKNYLNPFSVIASTTGNYSGIYDMSGGSWEYMAGYTTGGNYTSSSGLNPTNYASKYFDVYSSTADTNWNNRILGDATGEMGPFQSTKDPDGNNRYKSSWYQDYAYFAPSSAPWFNRGGYWNHGIEAGSLAFSSTTGGVFVGFSFRLVLAP